MTPIDTWKLCLDISNQDEDGIFPSPKVKTHVMAMGWKEKDLQLILEFVD